MALRSLSILFLTLAAQIAIGQQLPSSQVGAAAQANLEALVDGSATVLPRTASEGTLGTPYADNRWLVARLTLSNKMPVAPVPIKYDVLNKRLLMRSANRPADSLLMDDRLVTRFDLEEPTGGRRIFRRFEEAPIPAQRNDYVEVLHEGKYELLKRYAKVLRKANLSGAYSNGKRYDEVEDKSVYYLRRPDASLVPVKLSLKALQSAAPELAAALKELVAAKTAKTDAQWAAVLAAIDSK